MDKLKIRNVAVIAHVDHGKTTLIDAFLKQTHVFRENEEEMGEVCILDSNELEREKGITILAKNIAIKYRGIKINIIDTPGHADFSGEVERTLGMADGALLIVDAQEGPMPQTRFVLKKALALNLKIIVVINKIDKPFARVSEVIAKTNDLFLELATENQHLEFPILFAVGRDGKVFLELPQDISVPADVTPLLDAIINEIPAPTNKVNGQFKMLISSLDYNLHTGRILVGKIYSGKLVMGQKVNLTHDQNKTYAVDGIYVSEGLKRVKVEEAFAGDIIGITGINEGNIGQTIADMGDFDSLPSSAISEPTLHIDIGPNTSPFSGQEGQLGTGRQIDERLKKELETNLSLKFEKTTGGRFKVSGRGELHLAILLETLRREGFEMEVSRPEVIHKTIEGKTLEPYEEVTVIVLNTYQGIVIQELGKRQGELVSIDPVSDQETKLVYKTPTRTTIGLRGVLMTNTKGLAILSSELIGFEPLGQILPKIRTGALIASESGPALAYGLNAAQGRGITFIEPGTEVYEGMIIGQNSKEEDIEINVNKGKKLTNMRSKTSDGIIQLVPPFKFSLEQALGFVEDDELLEITPKSLRFRKKFLTALDRRRQSRMA